MTIATTLFVIQTLTFIAVVWLAVRAYRKSAKPAMNEAAMIPFLDDEAPAGAADSKSEHHD